LVNAAYGSTTFNVTKSGDYSWDIEWGPTYTPPGVITVSGAGILSFTGYQATLDLSAAGVATLLGTAKSADAILEVATLTSSGTVKQTAMHIPCTVYEEII
jgi:hypothetical protein